jgi:hypothetical protein
LEREAEALLKAQPASTPELQAKDALVLELMDKLMGKFVVEKLCALAGWAVFVNDYYLEFRFVSPT